jgi:LysM repeat protein
MSTPQHRKPSSATKARTVAIRAAAIGAVAVPGAALTAHELAGQQPETAPLQPLDDAQRLTQLVNGSGSGSDQDAFSPSEVQSTLHRISEQRETAAEHTESTESTESTAVVHKATAVTPAKDTAKPKKTTTVSYTVQEGDSLSDIAERTLGAGSAYKEIFALNKDRAEPGGARFTDPSIIQPGWTITLPSGAKTHTTTTTSWTSSDTEDSSPSSDARQAYSGSSTRAISASTDTRTRTSSTESASSSTTSDTRATGDLNEWIDEAVSVLAEHGTDVSYNAVYETVMHESGGNPDAVNGEDENAAEGHPSIGLMQTIQSTFNAYALPGYDDIYNPVDNIIAASRYAASVYGSLDEMVEARCDGSCWRGY